MNPAVVSGPPSPALRRLETWADEIGLGFYSFVNASHDLGSRPAFTPEYEEFLSGCLESDQVVVALGKYASGCLKEIGVEHEVLPHPSGLNRQINDREAVSLALVRVRNRITRQYSSSRASAAPGLPQDPLDQNLPVNN